MSIELVLSKLASIEAKLDRVIASKPPPSILAATDAEMDSQYGDPRIMLPKGDKWAEFSQFEGMPMSQCSPECLDQYAGLKLWQAGKDEEQGKVDKKNRPTAPYRRKDAALAMGWAKRIRASDNFPE